jgi:hypothetical protein
MKAGKVIHETKVGGNPCKPFFDAATNEVWVDLGIFSQLTAGGRR